jgi:hypothetical protein
MVRRLLMVASAVALVFALGTCTFDGENLCPLQCFEADCCDPVCRPAPKKGSACVTGEPLCTYSAFSTAWAAYTCVRGHVQCDGTLNGCCPSSQPSGDCAPPGFECRYDPNVLCVCDGTLWSCFTEGADLSSTIGDAGALQDAGAAD